MTDRTICFVYTQPVPGREAEFDEWYDGQHLHDVARIPGVLSAQRFDAVETEPDSGEAARCLAVYSIDVDPEDFVRELRSRWGSDEMPTSDTLDLKSVSMTFWRPRGERMKIGSPFHHSELTDPQLVRLREALSGLGSRPFSATEALSAALAARIENHLADIDSALSDLEDAGVIREVQKNPPRWQMIESGG